MDDPNTVLKKAVSEITYRINSEKLDPHTAAVKVAQEMDLNVNFIKRASEVINVALTYNHFKKHAEARDEDFPIIDATKVAAEVFGKKKATLNEKKSEWFPTIEPSDEVPNFNKILTNPKFKKAYLEILDTPEKHDSYGLSRNAIFEKSALHFDRLERVIDDLKTKKAEAKDRFNKTFFSLVNEFSKDEGYRSSFETFEKDAVATYGERALPYIEMIHSLGAINEKRASEKKASTSSICKEAKLLGNFFEYSDQFNKLASELSEVEKDYSEGKEQVKQAYHKYGEAMLFRADDEMFNKTASVMPETKVSEEAEETVLIDPVMEAARAKIAAASQEIDPVAEATHLTPLQQATLPTVLKKHIIAAKTDKRAVVKQAKPLDIFNSLMGQYKDRSTPGSSLPSTSYQDNLDRKLMLQDIMHTDPVLAEIEPKRVADAYQQMLHIAPELSKEKEIVRGTLREMVSSPALSPHTAQMLIEANTKFVKQRMMEEGVKDA